MLIAEEIKRKSHSAVAWSAIDIFSRQGVQFIVAVILARMLAPEEFGVIAMLYLFIGLASAFVDSGFSSALIQKQELTHEETSAVFYFNLVIGLVMAGLLCALAPAIARFYGIPILRPLTFLMALSLFVGAFGAVHQSLLTRDLDFRTQMRISIIASLLSGALAIGLAWYDWRVWSLAIQVFSFTLISTILLWYWRPWRPAMSFSFRALRSLFGFGSYLLLSTLLETVYGRLHTLIIGRFYSARDLGFYTRADGIQRLPASLISGIVNRVAFPIFSTAASDKMLLRRGIRKAITSVMFVNLPVMLGLAAVSRPLVLTLLGERWLPCVPYLQVLCLAGMLWPLHELNLSAIKAIGRSDLFFRLEIWKKILGLIVLLISAQISVLAMAWGQVAYGAICYFVNSYYTGSQLGYSAVLQMRDILPYACAAALMLFCLWPLTLWPTFHPLVQLSLQMLVGVLAYGTFCAIFRLTALKDLLQQLLNRSATLRSRFKSAKA